MIKQLALVLLFAVASNGFAAKKPQKVSNLSGFKGSYSGVILLTTAGGTYSGAASAKITALKKKEQGSITLRSTPSNGGMPIIWNETLTIRNKSLKYMLQADGTLALGAGDVNVKTKTITYSATFAVSGGTFFVRGTVTKKGSKKLKITETIIGPTSFSITYNLTKRGK